MATLVNTVRIFSTDITMIFVEKCATLSVKRGSVVTVTVLSLFTDWKHQGSANRPFLKGAWVWMFLV